MISRKQLDAIQTAVSRLLLAEYQVNEVILATAKEIFPEQLLASWEKESIIKHCAEGRNLEDCYGFSQKEGAISLELPTLYSAWLSAQAHNKIITALAKEMLLKPIAAGVSDETI